MRKVSVIIPCHNADKYLQACLNSVINQTLQDIEILAINDHSTDNTWNILTNYQQKYPFKMRIFSLTDQTGVSSARNVGLAHATGEYIGFVDADDVIALNMYEDFYKMAKTKEVPIVVGNCDRILKDEYLQNEMYYTRVVCREGYINYLEKNHAFFGESPACWDKLFSHDFIGDFTFLEDKIFEDVGFTYPLLLKAKEVYEYLRMDYLYRMTPGSITNRFAMPNARVLDILAIVKNMLTYAYQENFSVEQMNLLNDLAKSNLLNTLNRIERWSIPSSSKQKIIEKYLKCCFYYFPDLFSFSTKDGTFLAAPLIKKWQKIVSPHDISLFQAKKTEEDVIKLVKSLEISSN